MKQLYRYLISAHLEEANEGYFTHMGQALTYALWFIVTGLAVIVHALIPGLFRDAGRKAVRDMSDALAKRFS